MAEVQRRGVPVPGEKLSDIHLTYLAVQIHDLAYGKSESILLAYLDYRCKPNPKTGVARLTNLIIPVTVYPWLTDKEAYSACDTLEKIGVIRVERDGAGSRNVTLLLSQTERAEAYKRRCADGCFEGEARSESRGRLKSRVRSEGGLCRSEGGLCRSEGGLCRSEGGPARSEGGPILKEEEVKEVKEFNNVESEKANIGKRTCTLGTRPGKRPGMLQIPTSITAGDSCNKALAAIQKSRRCKGRVPAPPMKKPSAAPTPPASPAPVEQLHRLYGIGGLTKAARACYADLINQGRTTHADLMASAALWAARPAEDKQFNSNFDKWLATNLWDTKPRSSFASAKSPTIVVAPTRSRSAFVVIDTPDLADVFGSAQGSNQ